MNHSAKKRMPEPGKTDTTNGQVGQRSAHIMNVSSSMIGICLVIITSLRVFGQAEKTIVDQITAIAALFFMVSCMLSFLSWKISQTLSFSADCHYYSSPQSC
jgi:uncharacterized protein with PQ loop repeat